MEKAEVVKQVLCLVPKAFKYQTQQHQVISILPGLREFPESWVDSPWFKAHGVTRQEEKPEEPALSPNDQAALIAKNMASRPGPKPKKAE